jgi:hypothetical protein
MLEPSFVHPFDIYNEYILHCCLRKPALRSLWIVPIVERCSCDSTRI